MIDFGREWSRHACSMAPDASEAPWPAQRERENIVGHVPLADFEFTRVGGVGDGRGTPRDLGCATRVVADQQVTPADLVNSSPHSRRAADCASTKLGVFSPSPARWTRAHAIANTGTL